MKPICLLVSLMFAGSAAGENWPQWRGPRGDGSSPEKNLPEVWGPEQNILWRAPLAGLGTSTPIIWEDLVFLTSQLGMGPIDRRGAEFDEAVTAKDYTRQDNRITFAVQAFAHDDGHQVWEHRFDAVEPSDGLPSVHPKHNFATPSTTTDGELVYAWVGTGQLVALTLKGELVWSRHIGRDYAPFDVLWGHGSSPMLYRDTLFLLCDHPPGAYLIALDKKNGKELWKVDRGEGIRSYSTPFVVPGPEGDELVVNSSHRIEVYDPKTGKLLWHVGEPVTLAIGVPVFANGILYASRGYSSGPYSAIRLGGRGDVNATHVEWHVPTRAPYISSLLYYDEKIFMATERGIASVVDAKNGETLWRERLGGAFTASPVAGDGKVYLLNESGETFVFEAGATPELVSRNRLEERTLASPAISGGTLFIRTDAHLVAIGATRP